MPLFASSLIDAELAKNCGETDKNWIRGQRNIRKMPLLPMLFQYLFLKMMIDFSVEVKIC